MNVNVLNGKINDVDPKVCNDICGDTGASCVTGACSYYNIKKGDTLKKKCVNTGEGLNKCSKQNNGVDVYCSTNGFKNTCTEDDSGNAYCDPKTVDPSHDSTCSSGEVYACDPNILNLNPDECTTCTQIFPGSSNKIGYCPSDAKKGTSTSMCCAEDKISINDDGEEVCCGNDQVPVDNTIKGVQGSRNSGGCCPEGNACTYNSGKDTVCINNSDYVCTTEEGPCLRDNAYGCTDFVNKKGCTKCCMTTAKDNNCGKLSKFRSDIP